MYKTTFRKSLHLAGTPQLGKCLKTAKIPNLGEIEENAKDEEPADSRRKRGPRGGRTQTQSQPRAVPGASERARKKDEKQNGPKRTSNKRAKGPTDRRPPGAPRTGVEEQLSHYQLTAHQHREDLEVGKVEARAERRFTAAKPTIKSEKKPHKRDTTLGTAAQLWCLWSLP